MPTKKTTKKTTKKISPTARESGGKKVKRKSTYKRKPKKTGPKGPWKITPEILQKLEHGFAMGFTDEECTLYADIPMTTFYKYCRDNPEFGIKKEALKKKPSMKAKLNLLESINNGDLIDSKWWLERKNKDEFSLRQELKEVGTVINEDDLENGYQDTEIKEDDFDSYTGN